MINQNSKIFLAGHNGLVGSAILRKLENKNYKKIITINRKKLDLRDQNKVFKYLKKIKPRAVIVAAATVGGIKHNNDYKADFIYDNLSIQNNLIHGSYLAGVKDLIFLGSSCIYPKFSTQPIKEENLLSGILEKTNEPYAVAKIAGIKLCESYNSQYKTNYKCLMPSNSYGPNDNYDYESSHFFASIFRKIYEAKKKKQKDLILWGNGKTRREIIFSDDLADACIHFLKKKTKHSLINIGTGKDKTINQYAKLIMQFFNVKLKIKYINKSLIGTPRKLLSVSRAKKYGWKSKTDIKKGLKLTYDNFIKLYK